MKRYVAGVAICIVAFVVMNYGYSLGSSLLGFLMKALAGGVFVLAGMVFNEERL